MASINSLTEQLSATKVDYVNELSFAGRKMKLDTAEDAKEIVDAIKNCKDLQALRLEGNTLGLEAAIVIADALKSKKEFEMALWSDMYTGRLRSEIPPSLERLGDGIITAGAKLSVLDLSDNAFGPDGVKGIKNLLTSEACYNLKTLKLNNNGLGIGGGKILADAFITCHNSSKLTRTPFALKVFISGRNRLENEGAKALSEAFKIININDNTCTESGAKALAKCIPSLLNLETLNVGDCLLKDSGALALAGALNAKMTNLKEIILSFNEIRRDGGLAIAKSMANKEALQMLNLDGNQLGDSIKEIKRLMTDIGNVQALGSFEDNEEPDDDEDEKSRESDISGEDTDEDIELQVKGIRLEKDSPLLVSDKVNEVEKISTIEDARKFLSSPSLKEWQSLEAKQRKDLLKCVVREDLLPHADKVSKAFVEMCCSLSLDRQAIADVSDVVLRTAFNDEKLSLDDLVSNLLIYMGLIKSEIKVEKIDDLKGPLIGLRNVILQEYFPRKYTSHFIAFLMKSNRLLDKCQDERHALMQTLYQK
ncbi:ran GTPase-activating protein 1 isoform X3 [Hydra vulgaris]|uniref:ran GTPase-activating protein 1 isoform X3 n=1 Tax=Hydra vulgaris TaxID=6087 RepID=UPI0032EA3040